MGVSGAAASLRPLGSPFPNPSTGLFSVPVRLSSAREWSLDLYDITGRLVSSRTGVGETIMQISADAAGLRPGVYLLRLRSAGSSWTARLVLLR
jgi:hypothetical protein